MIYAEVEYDEQINHLIKENYDFIKEAFAKRGKRFVYLPYLTEELLASEKEWEYRNPVISIPKEGLPVLESNFMFKYTYTRDFIRPAFFMAVPYLGFCINSSAPHCYDALTIDVDEIDDAKVYFDYLAEQIAKFSPTWVEYRSGSNDGFYLDK